MQRFLFTVLAMVALAVPAFTQTPHTPTAHSPARHGSLTPHKKAHRQLSAAQKTNVSRMKECGRQWKADKAAGKTNGQKWPQYWSACSKRLKA